jgi:hypothetical protein
MNQQQRPMYLQALLCLLLAVFFGLASASALNFLQGNFFFSMLFGSTMTFMIYVLLGKKFMNSLYGRFIVLQQGLTLSLVVFLFLFAVPLNVDRSVSVWLLAKTHEKQQLSEVQLQEEAVFFFENSFYEVQRRVNEQLQLRNLELNTSNHYQVTNQGKILLQFFRFIAKVFNLNEKYANGL